jgi:hypothetical protein
MLTVRNPRPEPTLKDGFVEHRLQLPVHAFWAVGLICIAAVGPSDELAGLFAAILAMR